MLEQLVAFVLTCLVVVVVPGPDFALVLRNAPRGPRAATTAAAGIITGITLAIARVIGETAPLLIVAGFTSSMNYNVFSERMQSLPVFVYTQYANPGTDVDFYLERAWTGALTLIIIVMALNLIARLITRLFQPRVGR